MAREHGAFVMCRAFMVFVGLGVWCLEGGESNMAGHAAGYQHNKQ